jgi:O-antigen/teichoic acid export membrane protein
MSKTPAALTATSAWLQHRIQLVAKHAIYGRIVRGTFWSFASSGASQFAALVASILTARVLGQVRFGELGIVRSTVVTFGVVAGSSLGMVATKYVAEFRDIDTRRSGKLAGVVLLITITLGLIATLGLFIFARFLAENILFAADLTGALRIAALILIVQSLNTVLLGVLIGTEAFSTASRIVIADGLLTAVLSLAGAWYAGINGSITGSVLAASLGLPLRLFSLKKAGVRIPVSLSLSEIYAELPAVRSFILPAMLVGISAQPFGWAARVLVVRFGGSFASIGVFTAAYSWAQLILIATVQVTVPSMPILTNLYASGDSVGFSKMARTVLWTTGLIGFSCAAGITVFRHQIMAAYGPEYAGAYPVLTVVALAGAVSAVSQGFVTVIAARGHMWWQAFQSAAFGITLLSVTVVFAKAGAMALAFAHAAGYIVLIALQAAFELKSQKRPVIQVNHRPSLD